MNREDRIQQYLKTMGYGDPTIAITDLRNMGFLTLRRLPVFMEPMRVDYSIIVSRSLRRSRV